MKPFRRPFTISRPLMTPTAAAHREQDDDAEIRAELRPLPNEWIGRISHAATIGASP